MMMQNQTGGVFFDRDNTLTKDDGYCHKISDFQWLRGAAHSLALLHHHNIPVFIVTNQGGIAKGLFKEADMQAFHDHLCNKAEEAGGKITDIAFCPHHPEAENASLQNCDCRKPGIAMLTSLAEKWQIDLTKSVMIGDRKSDYQAGITAGMASYLSSPDDDLTRLVTKIIATHFEGEKES